MTPLRRLLTGPWMLFLARFPCASWGYSWGWYGYISYSRGYDDTPVGDSVQGASNNSNCTLKVLFLTYAEPSAEDELYAQGFKFWVNYTDVLRQSRGASFEGDLAGCLEVEPVFDTLVPEQGLETDTWTGGVQINNVTFEVLTKTTSQVQGWVAQGIRFVVLGVAFEDCSVTRGSLQNVGLHHIAVNVKDWFVFRRQSSERMWAVGSTHYAAIAGFADLTARYSPRVCVYSDDYLNYILKDLVNEVWKVYPEVGVEVAWSYEDWGNEQWNTYTMSKLASRVVEEGCDTLIALLSNTHSPAILQQELANLKAPLTAEFIWPQVNATAWKELGRMGEHVFTATDWRHDANFLDEYFESNARFVQLYRQWLFETLGEDRVPTVPEAASVAAGSLILAACHSLWRGAVFASFDEPPPSAFGSLWVDPSEKRQEDQFNVRVWEIIAKLDRETFWGTLHFDAAGANVGKNFLTLQYLQVGTAATVIPRKASSVSAVLPMDSFEARHGCPAGTYFFTASLDSMNINSTWTIPGVRCVNCSRLQYQDQFNQTKCLSCPPGEVSEEGATSCQQCLPGTHRALQDACTPCQLGAFSNSSGATQCERCPAGRFAHLEGRWECEVCPPGTFAQEPGGKTECLPCEPGFSTENESEQGSCSACARDSYSEELGSWSCTACPDTFGTEDIASDNLSHCLCPPGSYWHKATPESEPLCRTQHCNEALQCKGWSRDAPGAQAGHSVGLPPFKGAEPSYIVLCANTQDCPGNLEPGTCPEGHEDARSCAECKSGYGRNSQGGCSKCEGVKWYVPLLMISIAACLVGVVLYGSRFTENTVPAESVVKITSVIGIMLTALQILSVFRFIQVDWPSPIGLFHSLYSTLTHPLVLFSSVGCSLSITSAFHSYIILMSAWPAAAVSIFMLFKLAGVFSTYYRRKVTNVHIFQIEGILVLLFYTSISMFSLIPWQCERNPDGTSSVVAYREVLCWSSGDHVGMIAVSCVAMFLFIVGFMSLIAWATYQYPIKVTRPKGAKFLLMFRWIFNRFAPHKHYYALIYCSRNLLVTVLPVILVDNIPIQFLLVASVLQSSLIFQCWNKPWITELANKFDAASTVLLILLLIVGCLLISTDAGELAVILSVLVRATFSIFGLALFAALGYNLYLRLRPQRDFSFFLCHHKVAAAVLARWVKIELQLRSQGRVFLDSDELKRLDQLFEVVGYETENFVVLLTNETLSRIWCAGEITTALRKKVKTICIACNDYEEPTDEFISNLSKLWTDTQIAQVSRQGVSINQIQEAFVQFRKLPKIKHDRGASFNQQMKLIDTLMARGRGVTMPTSRPSVDSATPGQSVEVLGTGISGAVQRSIRNGAKAVFTSPGVAGHALDHQRNLMVGNLDDPEAFLVSRVLQVQLQQVLQAGVFVASKRIPEALEQLDALKPSILIAVLTAGVLSKPCFAVLLATVCAWETPPTFIPVVADDNFTFPDAKFWENLENGHVIDPQLLHSHQVSIRDVLQAYKALFLVISKRFSSHGSEKIQLTEVKEVADMWPLFRTFSSASSVKANMHS